MLIRSIVLVAVCHKVRSHNTNQLTNWYQRNLIMLAKASGLIFSLVDIASAQEVPFGIPQYVHAFFRDLPVSSFVFHSSMLTEKCINLVVAHDGFLCVLRNSLYFS